MGSALQCGQNHVKHCFLDRRSPHEGICEEVENYDLLESSVCLVRCVVSDDLVRMDKQKVHLLFVHNWPTQPSQGDVHCPWSDVSQDSNRPWEEGMDPGKGGPSEHAVVYCCHQMCSRARLTLFKSSAAYKWAVDNGTPAKLVYHPGQKCCLPTHRFAQMHWSTSVIPESYRACFCVKGH